MYIPRGVISISVYHAVIVKQTFSICPPACQPLFNNCDDQHHKPNNFEMAALDSSHKLPSFCILIKAKNEVLVASWKEVATPYFIFAKINLFLVR